MDTTSPHTGPVFTPAKAIAGCVDCHNAGGEQANTSGVMNCNVCHDIDADDHP